MTATEQRRLVPYPEAAAYANRSIRTLRYWVAGGRIPAYQAGPAPHWVLIDLNDIDALLKPRVRTGGRP